MTRVTWVTRMTRVAWVTGATRVTKVTVDQGDLGD